LKQDGGGGGNGKLDDCRTRSLDLPFGKEGVSNLKFKVQKKEKKKRSLTGAQQGLPAIRQCGKKVVPKTGRGREDEGTG